MNMNEIRDKVDSKEYNFLRTTPGLGNNICLLTLGGSYSYGTNINTPEYQSDLDIRGICLNTMKEILTMSCRDKPFENRETDTAIYPLKQMITLLGNANPNVIEILGTQEEHLLMCNSSGRLLRDNANIFLSRKAANSFGGYAIQQLRRLENALARDHYPQAEKEKHIVGSIEKQMLTMEDRYKKFTKSEIKLYVDKSDKEEYDSEIYMDISLNHYPLKDFKNVYSEMSNVIRDYDKLNHRNSKKDEVHLLKHSMHLVRLFLMGSEILEGKGIHTYRENDISLLLDIRNGKYTYEQIFEIVNVYEKRFKYAEVNSPLPENPDYDIIAALVSTINQKTLSNGYSIYL